MIRLSGVLLLLLGSAALAQPSPSPASAPPSVVVTAVTSRATSRTVWLAAELAANQNVGIYARVPGFVRAIHVDRGSEVRKGQELVVLEAPELAAQRAEAEAKWQGVKAQLQESEARRDSDAATFKRLKSASATPGVVAGNDVDVARRTAEASRARVQMWWESEKASRLAARAVSDMEAYLHVPAPFDGVITERNVHEGSLTGPDAAARGQPMLRIQDIARLRLVVPLPEADVDSAREGLSIPFNVPAHPERTYTGVVRRISHAVDPRTRSMPVELDVDNTDRSLAPGMYAQVKWPAGSRRPVLLVPPTAIATSTERSFVIAIRDGKARWVDVRRGHAAGDLVEVFGALQAGEPIVIRGSDELRDGTLVQVPGGKP